MRQQILNALAAFAVKPLHAAAMGLLQTLGYESQRTLAIHSLHDLQESLDHSGYLSETNAHLSRWRGVHMLFQLTDKELKNSRSQMELFQPDYDPAAIQSYVFFAIELTGKPLTRSQLALITRSLNRLTSIPVLILFKHDLSVSIAVINRRANKRDAGKDVLTRVSLIRDIQCQAPHRAHLDLLYRFALPTLAEEAGKAIRTFTDLHNAWRHVLSTRELNSRFYRELSDWFIWATGEIRLAQLPDHVKDDEKNRRRATQEFAVRLVCRLLFAWFLKEMKFIPPELLELFDITDNRRMPIRDAGEGGHPAPQSRRSGQSTAHPFLAGNHYYRGILQNIFFKALNKPMNQRRKSGGTAANDPTVSRADLKKLDYLGKNYLPDDFDYDLFDRIPYLNGGLFDTLPEDNASDTIEDRAIHIPNKLFCATRDDGYAIPVGTGRRPLNRPMEGLNRIFDRYRFTVAENTPLEEDVALDPELLGLVFENLLAEMDPTDETAAQSARKASGSYYTPRRIVDYMVNEALHLQMRTRFEKAGASSDHLQLLTHLFYRPEGLNFALIADRVVAELDALRVLDSACGSGAFPMGMLHRLVEILRIVDPVNDCWKKRLLERLPSELRADAEKGMKGKSYDYLRKLGLIQRNLYGLDIQPLAILISKLRFFLTLVIEQEPHAADREHNYGLTPLPNLETNLLCCNSLQDVEHDALSHTAIEQLRAIREEYYQPNTSHDRREELSKALGNTLAGLFPGFAEKARGRKLRSQSLRHEHDAAAIREWFHHATLAAPFFDVATFFPELGSTAPFHIVIGNPPYGGDKIPEELKTRLGLSSRDPYGAFIARFLGETPGPLAEGGVLAYIVSDTFMTIKTHRPLRAQMLQSRIHKMLRVAGDTFKAVVNCAVILCQRGPAPVEHVCQMADLTNVSIHDDYERFIEILTRTEGFASRQNVANQTYAIYYYRQSLIRTNSNLPFFVASPKLFTLMNDTTATTKIEDIGGKQTPVRTVQLNGSDVRLVRLGDIAEVVGGVKTYDNVKYVRSAAGAGRYDQVPPELIVRRTLSKSERESGIRIDDLTTLHYLEFDKSGEMVTDDGRLLNYYKPAEFYIDWSEEAVAFFSVNNGLRNKHRYFQTGITYSVTGVYAPTFRVGCGQVFGQKGATIFCDLLTPSNLLGQLCSRQCRYLTKNFLSHGVDATDSIIEQIVVRATPIERLSRLIERLVEHLKAEPRYDYTTHEQLEIDRLVYEAYGFDGEDITEIEKWYARRYPKLAAAERKTLAAKQGKTEEQLIERPLLHLYCDESRHLPHDREPSLLQGLLACPAEKVREMHRDLNALWKRHGLPQHFEAKWTKVSPGKQAFYLDLLEWFFRAEGVAFRAFILPDKQRLYAKLPPESRDDLYYRSYYQLLRGAIEPENRYRVFLDIKDTRGREKIAHLLEILRRNADDPAGEVVPDLQHVRSHEVKLLQITDLLLGAVGFARRPPAEKENAAKRAFVRHFEDLLGQELTADTLPGEEKVTLLTWHDEGALTI